MFEWDENKNQQNFKKHGIRFEEAQEIFDGIVFTMNISPERLKQIQNIPDSEIDTSEIPELDETFWQNARKVDAIGQVTVSLPLDRDILHWLKQQTPQYPTLTDGEFEGL